MKKEKELKKEKGLFRTILDWLKTIDEPEVEDGKINIRAFSDEDPKDLYALNYTSKNVDNMGNGMFMSREKHRAETVSKMKIDVETPNMDDKDNKAKKKQIIENYLGQ